jgi:hypothetical protein
MHLDELSHYRQAQSQPLLLRRRLVVSLPEAFEDVWQ